MMMLITLGGPLEDAGDYPVRYFCVYDKQATADGITDTIGPAETFKKTATKPLDTVSRRRRARSQVSMFRWKPQHILAVATNSFEKICFIAPERDFCKLK